MSSSPGWYPDPGNSLRRCYWDGRWTPQILRDIVQVIYDTVKRDYADHGLADTTSLNDKPNPPRGFLMRKQGPDSSGSVPMVQDTPKCPIRR